MGKSHSVDPLADDYPSLSLYVYPTNNPILFVDPTGMAYEISEEEWMRRAATNNWVEDTPEEIQRQIDNGTYSYCDTSEPAGQICL